MSKENGSANTPSAEGLSSALEMQDTITQLEQKVKESVEGAGAVDNQEQLKSSKLATRKVFLIYYLKQRLFVIGMLEDINKHIIENTIEIVSVNSFLGDLSSLHAIGGAGGRRFKVPKDISRKINKPRKLYKKLMGLDDKMPTKQVQQHVVGGDLYRQEEGKLDPRAKGGCLEKINKANYIEDIEQLFEEEAGRLNIVIEGLLEKVEQEVKPKRPVVAGVTKAAVLASGHPKEGGGSIRIEDRKQYLKYLKQRLFVIGMLEDINKHIIENTIEIVSVNSFLDDLSSLHTIGGTGRGLEVPKDISHKINIPSKAYQKLMGLDDKMRTNVVGGDLHREEKGKLDPRAKGGCLEKINKANYIEDIEQLFEEEAGRLNIVIEGLLEKVEQEVKPKRPVVAGVTKAAVLVLNRQEKRVDSTKFPGGAAGPSDKEIPNAKDPILEPQPSNKRSAVDAGFEKGNDDQKRFASGKGQVPPAKTDHQQQGQDLPQFVSRRLQSFDNPISESMDTNEDTESDYEDVAAAKVLININKGKRRAHRPQDQDSPQFVDHSQVDAPGGASPNPRGNEELDVAEVLLGPSKSPAQSILSPATTSFPTKDTVDYDTIDEIIFTSSKTKDGISAPSPSVEGPQSDRGAESSKYR